MPMAGGYRWMYQLTGLPGWLRFGYSPGWGGLPPGAQFLMQSGLWPQFWSWMQSRTPLMPPWPGMPKEQEVQLLEAQARALEGQLEQIRKRLSELEEEAKE